MTRLLQRYVCRLSVLLPCILGAAACADPFPDPHGDQLGNASAIAVGATVNGDIEIDIDRDWFTFVAEPFTTYTIEVTPSGLWDAEVAAYTFHGELPLGATNTVGAASAALSWLNTSYEMAVYVDIAGFAKFTTGTYDLIVTAVPMPDSDGDGLTDAFEDLYYGGNGGQATGNDDGDAFDNLTEQWLGTDPTNAASGLLITSMSRAGTSSEVTWTSRAGLVYQLDAASDIGSPAWAEAATVFGTGPASSAIDPSGDPGRFYRVRVKDVPDLHPDTATSAPILEGSARGAMDVSGDRDWFRFLAEEDTAYTVRLVPDGGWNAWLRVYALGAAYPLGEEIGLGGVPVEITWENTGCPQWVHLEISAAGSATKSYEVQVFAEPLEDSEPDGLPDAWELTYFTDLSHGPGDDSDLDGFTNEEEKKLGTDPDDPASGLFVIDVVPGAGSNTVTWVAAPLRIYEVQATTDPHVPWFRVGAATGMSTSAAHTDPGPTTQRFYRVLFTP